MLRKESDKKIAELFIEGRNDYVMTHIYLNEINLIRYADKLDLSELPRFQQLPETFIEKYADKIHWGYIVLYQQLSEPFIEKYAHRLHWYYISSDQKLSERFIEKHVKKVDWCNISKRQILSEKFIDKYQDKVDWLYISKFQKLSEEFIEKHADKVDWYHIIKYQQLSEDFMEKYSIELCWDYISMYQKLSEEFIEKHADTVSWHNISMTQILTENFIEKYKSSFLFLVDQQFLSHQEKRTKKQKLKEMKDYADKWNLEFNEDEGYLIAYREHDKWNCGYWNKTICYNELKYYKDWHCDLNPLNENSFGLGIWPEGNVKVKVSVDDWGCIVKGDKRGKVRVFGFTLLEIN